MSQEVIERYWKEFLEKTGRSMDTRYLECFYFELSEKWANELLRLVLIGKKRATSSSCLAYQVKGTTPPRVGDLSIVTDWDGVPGCVIETTAVTVIPFREVTFEIAKREGEDECLETWQQGHIKFFGEEGREVGYEFSWDMPVIFEDFRVVFPPEHASV